MVLIPWCGQFRRAGHSVILADPWCWQLRGGGCSVVAACFDVDLAESLESKPLSGRSVMIRVIPFVSV
jgi:hypothetical protein